MVDPLEDQLRAYLGLIEQRREDGLVISRYHCIKLVQFCSEEGCSLFPIFWLNLLIQQFLQSKFLLAFHTIVKEIL
jgi:hypothetical protein